MPFTLVNQVPDWVPIWLTPVWLLGMGVTAGLLILLLLWGVGLLVSRLPMIGRLAEHSLGRNVALAVLSIAGFALLLLMPLMRVFSGAAGDGGTALTVGGLVLWICAAAGGAVALATVLVVLTSRRAMAEVPMAIREGVMWPFFILLVTVSLFSIAITLVVRDPIRVLSDVGRLPFANVSTESYSIAAADRQDDNLPQPLPLADSFRGDEVERLSMTADQPLELMPSPDPGLGNASIMRVSPQDTYQWLRGGALVNPLPEEPIDTLYVVNKGDRQGTLNMEVATGPLYPEVSMVVWTALAVVVLFLVYVVHRTLMPRISAVALVTVKSEIAQPMFLFLAVAGSLAMLIFVWLSFFTFGEDVKMLKDSGMALVSVLCIVQAVWAASTSVSEEIEGRTALTVLSKPLGRRDFIFGKFLGIAWTVTLLFCLIGLAFLVAVAYKPVYESNETYTAGLTWQTCYLEMSQTVPGLALVLMKTLVLAAISVAIATRLSIVANFVISFSVYVLGHLTPLIVQSSETTFEIVRFVGVLVAVIFPNLELFNVQAATAGGKVVPFEYLGGALLYCTLYGAIATLLALLLFEDRDLA